MLSLALVALAAAALAQDGVPPVLVPRLGDVWNVGELRTVEWGLDGVLLNFSDGTPLTGFVSLSYPSGLADDPSIILRQHLAEGFPLDQRLVNIVIPDVPTRNDYAIFLNAAADGISLSDRFTIFNSNDPQGTRPAPTSFALTTAPPISLTRVLPQNTSTPTSSASPQSPTTPNGARPVSAIAPSAAFLSAAIAFLCRFS